MEMLRDIDECIVIHEWYRPALTDKAFTLMMKASSQLAIIERPTVKKRDLSNGIAKQPHDATTALSRSHLACAFCAFASSASSFSSDACFALTFLSIASHSSSSIGESPHVTSTPKPFTLCLEIDGCGGGCGGGGGWFDGSNPEHVAAREEMGLGE